MSSTPNEHERMVEEMVNDGGAVYTATVPDKKQLLLRAYDLYEAGKKKDEEAYYRIRKEMLDIVYEIQRTTLTTLITKVREETLQEERAFILNILDGIDIADGTCTTKAIRTMLAARYAGTNK